MDIWVIIVLAVLVLLLMEGTRYRRYRGGFYGSSYIYRPFYFWAPRPHRPHRHFHLPMGGHPPMGGAGPAFRGTRTGGLHAGGGRVRRSGGFVGGRSFGGGGRSFGGHRSFGGGGRSFRGGSRGGGRR